MKNRLKKSSKLLLGLCSVLLLISIFVPIWRIELDAPQYPEGLSMTIHANKLGGDVEIINGLNHYIGMKTLHAKDFIEFTVLPYIIGFYALLFLLTAFSGNKKILNFSFIAFLIFGIIAMIDFWRWEYNYGHNLDPSAAIIVPGMSYQPPLIGFKQLLNFGAFSAPSIGGWLFIIVGLILILIIYMESKFYQKKTSKNLMAVLLLIVCLSSCTSNEPTPIKINYDGCSYCEMKISNAHFGAELVTEKGKVFMFDDLSCMLNYISETPSALGAKFYVHDYSTPNVLIDATKAYYVTYEAVKSPMGGNTMAFQQKEKAEEYATKNSVSTKQWSDLPK